MSKPKYPGKEIEKTRRDERAARKAARRAMRPAQIDPNQLYSIEEAGAALDASRASVYKFIAAGKLQTVKLDDRARIKGSSIIGLT